MRRPSPRSRVSSESSVLTWFLMDKTVNSGPGRSFSVSDATIGGFQQTLDTIGFLDGTPSISANGVQSGIVWVIDRGSNELKAYDASDILYFVARLHCLNSLTPTMFQRAGRSEWSAHLPLEAHIGRKDAIGGAAVGN